MVHKTAGFLARKLQTLSPKQLAFALSTLTFVVLSFISGLMTFQNYETQRQALINYTFSLEQSGFLSSQSALTTNAKSIFFTAIFKEDIFKLMAEAYHGDAKIRDQKRHELFLKLYPTYQLLKYENIRQLHFHLPNAISFLRFHRLPKYGDDLSQVRQSIMLVNQYERPVTGFEEGRIFNGFRNVYPIHYKGEFVGTVEISFSIDAIFNAIIHKYRAFNGLILNKHFIEQKVFKEELDNYAPSVISDQYLIDNNVKGYTDALKTLDRELLNRLLLRVRDQFDPQKNRASFIEKVDQNYYIIHLFELKNVANQKVGYILSVQQDDAFKIISTNFVQMMLINETLLLLVSLLLFFYILHHIHKKRLLSAIASTDPLTGILNRSAFKTALQKETDKAQLNAHPLSMIFFDIDHFKQINDTHGHLKGDDVLKFVAEQISEGLTHLDLFARWGGEEFVILLPQTGLDNAEHVAERLRAKLAAQTEFPFNITSSFGVSEWRTNESMDSFMQRLDELLYTSKKQGRNRVTRQ